MTDNNGKKTFGERMEALRVSFEMIGLRIEKLTGLIEKDAENIRALARIAEARRHKCP